MKESIQRRVLDFISSSPCDVRGEGFNELFVELAKHQYSVNPVYRRFVDSLEFSIDDSWCSVPSVPVQFFKEFELKSYQEGVDDFFWSSSGTSGKSSKTFLFDAEVYDLVISKLWKYWVPEFKGETLRLIPNPVEWPDSSLAHFFTVGQQVEQQDSSWIECYYFRGGSGRFALDLDYYVQKFKEHEESDVPLRLCGTSYAIAYVLDHLEKTSARFRLPIGSMVIDTGGYKGVVRDRTRSEFLDSVEYCLDIPRISCLNEYGMSELSSHTWSTYKEHQEWWAVPPWVRVRSVDPVTLLDKEGGVGVFYDLANVWSCCAIQTQDLVEIRPQSSEQEIQYIRPLGRVRDAEVKGCSITAEESMK